MTNGMNDPTMYYNNDSWLEYFKDKIIYYSKKIGIENIDDDLLLDLIVELDLDKLIEETS